MWAMLPASVRGTVATPECGRKNLGFTDRGAGMNRHKGEENTDLTTRLRQLEQLMAPQVVAPRSAADDAIETRPPLLHVEPHRGRLYVVGHERRYRPVTLLAPVRPRGQGGPPHT